MFLYAIEFELLETLHLPLVIMARQRVAAALATPQAPASDRGDIDLMTGEAAAAALTQALAARHARPGNVFHNAGFVAAMSAQAEAAQEPVVVARLRHGTAMTFWPLRIVRRRGITRAIDLTAPLGQYGDTIGPHVTAGDLASCTAELKACYGVDVIEMRRVRADAALAAALSAAGAKRHTPQTAPFIDLTGFGDFAHYEAQASRHTRRNRRQRRQKLEAAHGPLTFAVVPARDHDAVLRAAIGWKHAWLSQHGCASAVFDGGVYEQALLQACDDPLAYLSVLHVGETLAAVELGFARGAHYAAYLGSYNPAFAAFSVGQEQMLRTIAWCFTQNFARYDLLAPADAYKLTWSRGKSEAVHDYSLALSWKGAGDVFVRRHASAGARRVFDALPTGMRRHALQWRARLTRR